MVISLNSHTISDNRNTAKQKKLQYCRYGTTGQRGTETNEIKTW